ncbi:unnamed protein product [Moneuplotes crassus]|uniref:Kelch motif family protein n=1 Tax=Euplotes crassus TaxID=5936 RepID=A0AAD1UPV4_EUPCR|nr:unnamed protein product [Moneuplotes crassus]
MSLLYKNSAILIVLGYLDKTEQLYFQLINKRFYEKIIPLLFMTMKVPIETRVFRCKSGQTEYVEYNLDAAEFTPDSLPESPYSYRKECIQKPFKSVFSMSGMNMQFPLNHKHAFTSDNRLFVIGGTFNLTNAYRETYEVLQNHELIDKQSLNTPRHSFACISVSTSILVLGGYFSRSKTLSSCEIYNSLLDEWVYLPNLNYSRGCMGACTFNNYIYYFGGATKMNSQFHNTIERLNISSITHGRKVPIDLYQTSLEWEVITPKFSTEKLKAFNLGCCQINNQEILIFGGAIPKSKPAIYVSQSSRSTFIFNTKECSLKFFDGDTEEEEKKVLDYEAEDYCLLEKDIFYHNDQILYKNKVYCLGKENFHIFDCVSKTWEYALNYQPSLTHINSENDK